MSALRPVLFIASLVLLFWGCNRIDLSESTTSFDSLAETKAVLSEKDARIYDVTEADIDKYVQFKKLSAESKGESLTVSSITPFVCSEETVTSYIINYNKGCEIIAADKRCPAILAKSDDINIDINLLPPPALDWLMDLNKPIKEAKIRRGIITLSEDDSRNVDFWNCLEPDSLQSNRSFEIPDDYPSGHWELIDVHQQLVSDVIVGHLVSVKWGQGSPYNTYCPLVDPNWGPLRSPAGCVAVAGAQLLYYFHNYIGVPSTAPSSGSVSGYVYPTYTVSQSFTNESSTIWTQMSSQPQIAALLIGAVGKAVGTSYASPFVIENGVVTNLQSGAPIGSFPNYAFDNYNLSWTWRALTQASDSTAVIGSINNGSPVYVGASNSDASYNHAFLIDAWKQDKYQYVYTYEYVFDDPEAYETYLVPCEVVITYSSPVGRYFAMNWGWEGSCDNIWFAPLGIWNPDGISFDGNRYLYYNFNLME